MNWADCNMRFQTIGKSSNWMVGKLNRKKECTGQEKRRSTEWAVNLDAGFNQRAESRTGKKKLPIGQLATRPEWWNIRSQERVRNQESWNVRWAKGENGLNGMQFKLKFRKVFIKGWTNHGVWKLIKAGDIQWEGWRKQVRKERHYHSVQVWTAGRNVLFDRKKEENTTNGTNSWSTMARSDGLMREIQLES